MTPIRLLAAALCAMVFVAGCKKSGSSDADAGVKEAPSAEWVEGKLPATVSAGTPKQGGTLTVRVPAEPAMLNQLHDSGQDAWGKRMMTGHVVETLLEIDPATDPEYRLRPLLAESWEVSGDGLTATFRLRHGVKFHDGQAFTSKDVIATLDAISDPKKPTTAVRSNLGELASYSAPDAHTVVFKWKKPYFLAVRNVGTLIPIYPSSALQGDFDGLAINRAPVGTGPFAFSGWETARAITLVRNESYWGDKAHLDKVVFRVVKDHTVATQLFERGDLDVMTYILPSVWRELEKPDPKNAWAWREYNRIAFTENAYNWIGWNLLKPQFKDVAVRRALGHLIPYDQIFKHVSLGLEPITTCPYYSKSRYCDPALEAKDSKDRIGYEPWRARKLLYEAGYRDGDGDGVLEKDGVPLRFTFLVFAHSVNLGKLAPILQDEFKKAGVALDIERVDWAVYTERLRKHDFDMVSLGWNTQDVEDDLFSNFHSSQSQGGRNYISVKDARLDALLEQSRAELDPDKRIAINRQIHRIIYGEQLYTFLGVRSMLEAAKKHVRGLRPAINWYRLDEVWLEDAKGSAGPDAQ